MNGELFKILYEFKNTVYGIEYSFETSSNFFIPEYPSSNDILHVLGLLIFSLQKINLKFFFQKKFN